MQFLINDVVGQMLCGNILTEEIGKTAEGIVKTCAAECAHVAKTIYIDCEPEQQEVVDMVQQLIQEAILKKFG